MKKLVATATIALALVVSAAPAGARTAKPSKACVSALADADIIIAGSAALMGNVGAYFDVIGASASGNANLGLTGVTQFIQDSTAAADVLTGQMADATPGMAAAAAAYRRHSAACRKG